MYNAAISTNHAVTTHAIFFKLCLVIRGHIFLQPRYLHEAVSYTSVGSYVITHPGVMLDPFFVKFMWQLSPASRTREAVDDCLVPVPWCRAHTIAAHAVLVLFPHFRRYTRRLRTCRRSLSLSKTGRAVHGGCALLLPDV